MCKSKNQVYAAAGRLARAGRETALPPPVSAARNISSFRAVSFFFPRDVRSARPPRRRRRWPSSTSKTLPVSSDRRDEQAPLTRPTTRPSARPRNLITAYCCYYYYHYYYFIRARARLTREIQSRRGAAKLRSVQ